MFTSRSEFRLTLRAENADRRLSETAIGLGLLDEEQIEAYRRKTELLDNAISFMLSYSLPNQKWFNQGIESASAKKSDPVSAFKVLSFPRTKVAQVQQILKANQVEFTVDERIEEHLEVECQYSHYSKQQASMANALQSKEFNVDISHLDFHSLKGRISTEDLDRLLASNPSTLQGAVRAGLKQAAIAHIYNEVKRVK